MGRFSLLSFAKVLLVDTTDGGSWLSNPAIPVKKQVLENIMLSKQRNKEFSGSHVGTRQREVSWGIDFGVN